MWGKGSIALCILKIDWVVGNGFQHLGALDGSTAGTIDAPNIPKDFWTVETRQILNQILPHRGIFHSHSSHIWEGLLTMTIVLQS